MPEVVWDGPDRFRYVLELTGKGLLSVSLRVRRVGGEPRLVRSLLLTPKRAEGPVELLSEDWDLGFATQLCEATLKLIEVARRNAPPQEELRVRLACARNDLEAAECILRSSLKGGLESGVKG